ncbi:MAG: thioredoxin family protein, partial [Roseiflexaceae bacterium]|nr:thioredoxin family protein [Roseiflexaceae bacterium]
TIAKVNIDDDAQWAGKLGVMAIPTMIVFKGGKEIQRIQGALPKKNLKEAFDSALKS